MRRYAVISLVLLGVVMILLVGAALYLNLEPRSVRLLFAFNTDLSKERIAGMIPNGSELSGQETEADINVARYNYFQAGNGLLVATEKKGTRIKKIVVTGKNEDSMTEKGVRIGSSVAAITTAYGKAGYKRSEQGADIIGYVDKKNRLSLEFWTHEDYVREIRFDVYAKQGP